MIEAEIRRNDELLMARTYYDPSLTLESVMQKLESYVVGEMFNVDGECTIKVRFQDLRQQAA